jgi:YhcH/YjgK/YiaL family protein
LPNDIAVYWKERHLSRGKKRHQMICDRIENRHRYRDFNRRVAKALDHLARTDFSGVPNGRQEIDGDDLYAVVQRYAAKPVSQARWEIHRQYLDVQYIAQGSERIGYAPWTDGLQVEEAYDPKRDAGFYAASGVLLPVKAGMFTIFLPEEIHAPGLTPDASEIGGEILKIVIKCRWM